MDVMRIHCWLFGCGNGYGACPRCGECLYGGEWIERGKLLFLILLWYRIRYILGTVIFGRKCEVCGKRFRIGVSNWCCSDKCLDKWIPF